MSSATPSYRALSNISLGLADGRTLHLSVGDVLPPSWAAQNESVVLNLISSDSVVPTAASAEEIAQADRASEHRTETSRSASNIQDAA